jgi:hypothetical protein
MGLARTGLCLCLCGTAFRPLQGLCLCLCGTGVSPVQGLCLCLCGTGVPPVWGLCLCGTAALGCVLKISQCSRQGHNDFFLRVKPQIDGAARSVAFPKKSTALAVRYDAKRSWALAPAVPLWFKDPLPFFVSFCGRKPSLRHSHHCSRPALFSVEIALSPLVLPTACVEWCRCSLQKSLPDRH